MRLPFLNNKKDDKGYYLALILDDERATSVILEEVGGFLKIIGKHTEHFTSNLETIPNEELITTIDRTISKAEEILPPNIETHKTIFGVKENWVETDSKKIKKEYLSKLKKVCDSLDLSPIGFMVINEAIANLMQHEEGTPLSAILIEISKKTLNLMLFRGGKVSEQTSGPLEQSIPATVDTLLRNFTAEVFPTKILVLHSSNAKELSSHFANHEWSKALPFLHVPEVTVLPNDYDTKAVAYGASQQMGFGMQNISEKMPDSVTNELPLELPPSQTDTVPVAAVHPSDENFGFVIDQDIAKIHKSSVSLQKNIDPSEAAAKKTEEAEEFETIADERVPEMKENHNPSTDNYEELQNTAEKSSMLAGVFTKLPKFSLPKIGKLSTYFAGKKGLNLVLIIIGVIFVLGIALTIFYLYSVKAQVIISVKPKQVTQDSVVTFSTTGASDFSQNIISSHAVSTSITGDTTIPTTGKKDTGTKAKGTVTIYNSSDNDASLTSGTNLTSSNGLIFTTDKDVSIASASGDIFSGTKPGTTQVSVTARDLGTDSNLPSGAKFSIGTNSNLAAKNESAFSGGNKKTITVVSSADLAKLKTELPKSLETKAKDELSKKIDSNETLLPGFTGETVEKIKYDKGIDDEAKQVKLSATVNFNAMSYQNSDLDNFDKSILKDHFSQDISFADNSLKNEITNANAKSDKEIKAKVKITAGLLPKINNDEVVNKIKNKSEKDAKSILADIPQVSGSEIKFSPNILFLASVFPSLPKNISIIVKSNE